MTRGDPAPDEIAALVVALAVVTTRPIEPVRRRAGWRRPEREPGFAGPRSWRR